MKTVLQILVMILIVPLAIGCQSNDARLTEMAQRQEEREAEHAREMAQLQKEATEGGRRLVEADAQSRKEFAALQRDLRGDQAVVGQQRDALEVERRQLAAERRWDSIVGPAITGATILLVCLLPLVLCAVLLRSLRHPQQPSEALAEVLLEELTADEPRLLPRASPPPIIGGPSTGPIDNDQVAP